MKKYFLIFLLTLITISIHAQKGFTVEGTLKGLADDTLTLVKVYNGDVLYQTVSKDGKFIFKHSGKFIGDKVMLTGGGIKTRTQFYIEPGKIKVEGDLNNLVASGTPSNDALNKYTAEIAPVEKKIADLRKKIIN